MSASSAQRARPLRLVSAGKSLDVSSSAASKLLPYVKESRPKKIVNSFWSATGKPLAEPHASDLYTDNALPPLRVLLQRPVWHMQFVDRVDEFELVLWNAADFPSFFTSSEQDESRVTTTCFARIRRMSKSKLAAVVNGTTDSDVERRDGGGAKPSIFEFVQIGQTYTLWDSKAHGQKEATVTAMDSSGAIGTGTGQSRSRQTHKIVLHFT